MVLLTTLVSLMFPQVNALEFRLPCKDHNEKDLPLAAMKVPVVKAGRWENQYFVEGVSAGTKVRVALTSRGSGDEDYTEYVTGADGRALNISGAAIQNRFAWVSLVNLDGSSFADCRQRR